MFLSDFSIKQPVTTVVIIIVLMCLGLLALKKLRVNQIPDVEQPVMVVNFPYPGASPETVEREIINRVEKSLQSIPQVYEIRSTASESNAQIVIIFNFKKNMSEAADEIRNAIASVRHKLPIEMREPVLYAHRSVARSRSCNLGAVVAEADARARSRASPKTCSPTSCAASTASPWSTSTARCGASSRCCCARRSCANTTFRSARS